MTRWSDIDDFAMAGPMAKGMNMLGIGLLLACTGLIIAAMFGPSAGIASGLAYAGAIGTVGIAFRAAAYWLAAYDISERGVVVPEQHQMRGKVRSLTSKVETDRLVQPNTAALEAGFVAMLAERQGFHNGKGRVV